VCIFFENHGPNDEGAGAAGGVSRRRRPGLADLGEVTKAECLYDMRLHGRGLLVRGIRTEQISPYQLPTTNNALPPFSTRRSASR
jgi:hypothetical protein